MVTFYIQQINIVYFTLKFRPQFSDVVNIQSMVFSYGFLLGWQLVNKNPRYLSPI